MGSNVAEKCKQVSNALKALGFAPEVINMEEWINLWNIKNKYPLEYDFVYGEAVVNGRKLAIEVYFMLDSEVIEAVLQTENKRYSNDFEKVPDVRALVQYVYSWLVNEKKS